MFSRKFRTYFVKNIWQQNKHFSDGLRLEKLTNRSALKIKGEDAETFLQGLITNDMTHLKTSSNSIYTMFLNSKGRVLADSIIYRAPEENTYLLDVDSSMTAILEKHLSSYILRKKVEVFNLESLLRLWVLFDPNSSNRTEIHPKINEILTKHKNPNKLVCSHSLYEDVVFNYKDPRFLQLGLRILTSTDIGGEMIRDKLDLLEVDENTKFLHKQLRYKLGVGEGIEELPPGKCFPLEANCDYLHGISFQKGCYLGQELTARTYHTGVIRKRLMPLIFQPYSKKYIPELQEPILTAQDKIIVGKLRGIHENYGLGLLRIDKALKSNDLVIGELKAVTEKPAWWPIEAPKEIVKTDTKSEEEPTIVKDVSTGDSEISERKKDVGAKKS